MKSQKQGQYKQRNIFEANHIKIVNDNLYIQFQIGQLSISFKKKY